jgi:quercetin dioxygenase-like cupin family protein
MASTPLGKLPDAPVFWTLDTYPTRAAAEAAASKGSTVVEALGKIWLFTVGERANVPTAGTRVSQIGPLPLTPNQEYTAQYRESIMQPGAISRTHLHSGPEIFYTEAGETCLETPTGKQLGKKGVDVIIPEGAPMELMATGTEARRSLVLVLHNSSKPHTTLVTDWKSKGLCQASQPPAP